MAVNENDIRSAIIDSVDSNGGDLTQEESKNKFATDLAKIIKDAILSADVIIKNTELTGKVNSSSPGSPVVCTQNLNGELQ